MVVTTIRAYGSPNPTSQCTAETGTRVCHLCLGDVGKKGLKRHLVMCYRKYEMAQRILTSELKKPPPTAPANELPEEVYNLEARRIYEHHTLYSCPFCGLKNQPHKLLLHVSECPLSPSVQIALLGVREKHSRQQRKRRSLPEKQPRNAWTEDATPRRGTNHRHSDQYHGLKLQSDSWNVSDEFPLLPSEAFEKSLNSTSTSMSSVSSTLSATNSDASSLPPRPITGERQECSSCGRRFAHHAYLRHVEICHKVKNRAEPPPRLRCTSAPPTRPETAPVSGDYGSARGAGMATNTGTVSKRHSLNGPMGGLRPATAMPPHRPRLIACTYCSIQCDASSVLCSRCGSFLSR